MKSLSLLIALITILTQTASANSLEQTYNEILNIKSDQRISSLHKLLNNTHKTVLTYRSARTHMFGRIHLQQDDNGHFVKEVYCGKSLRKRAGVGPSKIPDHKIVNAEHTWPKFKFSRNFPYDTQVSDMHNLYPSDSKANSKRGHLIFAEVSGDYASHDCNLSLVGTDTSSHKSAFEPPQEHKGNVARALFYFSVRYNIRISKEEESHLRRWHELDPVDAEEKMRNREIMKLQGNSNPFIDRPDLVEEIANF